jgi:hypothetical protein
MPNGTTTQNLCWYRIPELSGKLSRRSEPEGASHESGIHHQANQGRDRKVESGIASAGREDEGQGTAEDISRWKKKNCSRTTGTVGED